MKNILWNLINEDGCMFYANAWEIEHKWQAEAIVRDIMDRSGEYLAHITIADGMTDGRWNVEKEYTVRTNGDRTHYLVRFYGEPERITRKQIAELIAG